MNGELQFAVSPPIRWHAFETQRAPRIAFYGIGSCAGKKYRVIQRIRAKEP